MHWISLKITLLLIILSTSFVEVLSADPYRVSAWTWGDPESLVSASNRRAIDEVNVVWYFSQANGTIKFVGENPTFIENAQAKGIKVLATVNNYNLLTRDFDPHITNSILKTNKSRSNHVNKIHNLCIHKGYDGIDLDWESMYPSDRNRFTHFVTLLSKKLHQSGKILSIAIHPKTSEPGDWNGPKSQDWKKLGAIVDEFKIMTYEYSGSWSKPGPISPLNWIDNVLTFAESIVPIHKIMMGVPFYGYDWKGSTTTNLFWKKAQSLITTYSPKLLRHLTPTT